MFFRKKRKQIRRVLYVLDERNRTGRQIGYFHKWVVIDNYLTAIIESSNGHIIKRLDNDMIFIDHPVTGEPIPGRTTYRFDED